MYNHRAPDFFMISSELPVPYDPKKCWRIKRLRTNNRDDLLLIKVDPPFEVEGILGDKVIIAAWLSGTSLFPISQWPLPVYVMGLKKRDVENWDMVEPDEMTQLDWAELRPTEEEARQYNLPPESPPRET
jgi:hypothetical protein